MDWDGRMLAHRYCQSLSVKADELLVGPGLTAYQNGALAEGEQFGGSRERDLLEFNRCCDDSLTIALLDGLMGYT
eukprot:1390569-Amorphochlora_amoeboformis.AAC.1